MLVVTSTTGLEMQAARRNALWRRLQDLEQLSTRVAFLFIYQAHTHKLARQGKGHEDSPSIRQAAQDLSPKGKRIQLDVKSLYHRL
jgi:hypothetical protein